MLKWDVKALKTWPGCVRSVLRVYMSAAGSGNGARSTLRILWPCARRYGKTCRPALPLPPVKMMRFPPGFVGTVLSCIVAGGLGLQVKNGRMLLEHESYPSYILLYAPLAGQGDVSFPQ